MFYNSVIVYQSMQFHATSCIILKLFQVLDSGINTSIEDFTRVCPPKILIFDLRTDQLVRSIIFPREVLRPASLFANLILDESVQGTCDSTMVYIADTAAPGKMCDTKTILY